MSGFGYINAGKDFILKYTNDLPNAILIASTKLHLFNSIIIAQQFPNYNYHFFYIDQNDKKDPYFEALKSWSNNPFTALSISITNKSTLFLKRRTKRQSIKEMISKAKELQPKKVIVGNNRKNEISALLNTLSKEIKIAYMDDGIHSYLPEKSSLLKYTFFDSFLKTLFYGTPISTPKHIGCSKEIGELYLYKPEFRHHFFKQKHIHTLDISLLHTDNFLELIHLITQKVGISLEKELKDLKNIFFLPHPKSIQSDYLNKLSDLGNSTAVKLHPRDYNNGTFFRSHGIKVIDNNLTAELIFLGIQKNIKVFGFTSSALLMAKWLCPTLDVYSLKFDNATNSAIERLMQENEVKILPVTDLHMHLKT